MPLDSILSAAGLVLGVVTTLIQLSTKSGIAEMDARHERQRTEDREWMEQRFVPFREVDQRITTVEDRHEDLSRRVDDHEKRLRIVERRRRRHVESAD